MANGSVLLVKTHEWGKGGRAPFQVILLLPIHLHHLLLQAAILLLREPFPSILAEFNRRSGGHIGHASQEKFQREGGKLWTDFVRAKAQEWEDMNTDWLLHFPGPLLVLSYSSLRAQVEQELRRTLDFLGVSLTREQLACALRRQEGIYRRRPGSRSRGQLVGEDLQAMLQERWGRVKRIAEARALEGREGG